MNLLHEWPLVTFTLAIQLSVGCCLALLVLRGLTQTTPAPGASERRDAVDRWIDRPLLVAGGLALFGLAASLLHLGAPMNALRTLANLRHSWLSREILAGLLFVGLWGITFRIHRRPPQASWARPLLALALVLTGLLLIGVMARLYLMPAQALWNTWLTPVHFYLSTLLLGTVAIAAHIEHDPIPSQPPARGSPTTLLLSLGLIAIIAQLAVILSHPVTAAMRSPSPGATLSTVRLIVLLAAAFLIIVALARPHSGDPTAPTGPPPRGGRRVLAALVLLLISEAAGRILFYAAGVVEPF